MSGIPRSKIIINISAQDGVMQGVAATCIYSVTTTTPNPVSLLPPLTPPPPHI